VQRLLKHLLLLAVFACMPLAFNQDSQSVGDVARQARQQKQDKAGQDKAAPPSKPPKVITNDEIPEHPGDASEMSPSANDAAAGNPSPSLAGPTKASPDQWKALIRAQKNVIRSLQSSIDKLNDSIQFAPGNCVAGCVQWNERQKQKQQEVERLRSNLDTQKKSLERLQVQARQQGYGSSIYDP
jgi:hypothetical protein